MPAEQPLGRERLFELLRRIEQHVDYAIDVAICGDHAGNLEAESPGQR